MLEIYNELSEIDKIDNNGKCYIKYTGVKGNEAVGVISCAADKTVNETTKVVKDKEKSVAKQNNKSNDSSKPKGTPKPNNNGNEKTDGEN